MDTDTETTTSLPPFLVARKSERALSAKDHPSSEVRELERQTFAIAFETLIEHMMEGLPMDTFCREYHRPLSPARFRAWIRRNPKYLQAYNRAKEVGAEAVEDSMMRISDGISADGNASMEDVARSTLRINTRKWLLGVWDREKYGDVKKVQTTSTVTNISALSTAEIENRLLKSLGMDAQEVEFYVSEDNDNPDSDNTHE